MNREDVLAKLKALKPKLQAKYPLESMALFGSYARNEADENSDVDVLVELNGKMGIQFIDMADEIEDEIGVKTDVIKKGLIRERLWKIIKPDLIYV